MRYIKTYESRRYEWDSIQEETNAIIVYPLELATEMENVVAGKSKYKVIMMEDRYKALVRDLLENKVISFECDDCNEHHYGLCESVDFLGDPYGEVEDDCFNVQYVQITLDNMDDSHNIEDKVIVHLDKDPQLYIDTKKYNL